MSEEPPIPPQGDRAQIEETMTATGPDPTGTADARPEPDATARGRASTMPSTSAYLPRPYNPSWRLDEDDPNYRDAADDKTCRCCTVM